MKGAYLIPDTSEEGKLQGAIGAAEIKDVNYDTHSFPSRFMRNFRGLY